MCEVELASQFTHYTRDFHTYICGPLGPVLCFTVIAASLGSAHISVTHSPSHVTETEKPPQNSTTLREPRITAAMTIIASEHQCCCKPKALNMVLLPLEYIW
jgi:hypothetical protein